MPPCCRCNSSGKCQGCSCVKGKVPCTSCLPMKCGTCSNAAAALTPAPAPDPTINHVSPIAASAIETPNINESPQHVSNDLCHALAFMARRISSTMVDPQGLSAFTACRLIALDKNPGVHPIETAKIIISKAILHITRGNIQQVAGSTQLCAGQIAGIEATIHATRLTFSADTTEGALLMDASKAFNSLTR